MPETLQYFGQLGININEVYGMSECTGATTWSLDETHTWGSCGFAMPGCEVVIKDLTGKILTKPGEEGELCYRGRHIMMGARIKTVCKSQSCMVSTLPIICKQTVLDLVGSGT